MANKKIQTVIFKDKSKYVGEFDDGIKEGFGTLTYPNEDEYEGEWKHNQKHGQGTYTFAYGQGEYKGEFKEGMYHGKGTLTLGNGDKFTGISSNSPLSFVDRILSPTKFDFI